MVLTPQDPISVVFDRVKRSAQTSVTGDFHKLSFQAMNTVCRVHFRAANANLARDLQNEVLSWVAWFEARYSRFIPDSLIGRINSAAGKSWVDVDPETDALFNLCQVFFRDMRLGQPQFLCLFEYQGEVSGPIGA